MVHYKSSDLFEIMNDFLKKYKFDLDKVYKIHNWGHMLRYRRYVYISSFLILILKLDVFQICIVYNVIVKIFFLETFLENQSYQVIF